VDLLAKLNEGKTGQMVKRGHKRGEDVKVTVAICTEKGGL